jgi:hypothetical protein
MFSQDQTNYRKWVKDKSCLNSHDFWMKNNFLFIYRAIDFSYENKNIYFDISRDSSYMLRRLSDIGKL